MLGLCQVVVPVSKEQRQVLQYHDYRGNNGLICKAHMHTNMLFRAKTLVYIVRNPERSTKVCMGTKSSAR